jgi:hypothetical protein
MTSLRLLHKATVPLLTLFIVLPGRPDAQSIKTLVDSQNYVFETQIAQPLRGPVRHLTTDNYTVRITRDKIVSDLPYFGRAYVAPIDPDKSALRFTLNTFDYKVTPGKKEGWTVLIKPKDKTDIQEIQFNISSAGYTSLQVISSNRDAISFDGIITAPVKP